MRDILLLDLNFDIYKDIAKNIPRVEGYFDFPSSMIAFGESLKSSSLFHVNYEAFFRKRNKHFTLITYFCSSSRLIEIIHQLQSEGNSIKCLNFSDKPMDGLPCKKSHKEWYVESGFDPIKWADALKEQRHKRIKRIRRALKIGMNNYSIENELNKQETFILFNQWAEMAKVRHFMVVTGHYLKYLERYFQYKNNVKVMGFRRKSDGILYGIAGYEIFKNHAQVTIGKHLIGDEEFPRFYFLKMIEEALNIYKVKKMFCGSTADYLKETIGLSFKHSYKLDMDRI